MGDIDFEEQLKLEKLEKDRLASGAPKERVDPDGTVYEWDYSKNAWFPKVLVMFRLNQYFCCLYDVILIEGGPNDFISNYF